MDYMTKKEATKNWGITDRMVVYHCSAGRIKGAKKWGIHGLFLLTLKNRLTDETGDIPVIFLTASGDEASVVTGLLDELWDAAGDLCKRLP